MRRIPVLVLTLVALAVATAWTLEQRLRPADPAATRAPGVAPAAQPTLDTAEETWHLPAPVAAPAPPRAASRVPTPAPDWSALRADVAVATAPAPAQVALATPPAELEIALSARERRALIASAREAEGAGTPRGYRPGIAVIIPGGSSTDGVCR
jgi:hypothetical protein